MMSWWPQVHHWENCGLDWGYWTPFSEFWFQKRLENIRTGKEGLKNATHWRGGAIKFRRGQVNPMVVQNMEDADKFLMAHVS